MNRYVLERPTMKKKIGFYVLLLYVYVTMERLMKLRNASLEFHRRFTLRFEYIELLFTFSTKSFNKLYSIVLVQIIRSDPLT